MKKVNLMQKDVQIKKEAYQAWLLQVTMQQPWYAYEDKAHENQLGLKTDVAIVRDKFDYGTFGIGINKFEKLTIKTPTADAVKFAQDDIVKFGRVDRITVYGDYRNQLSITATLELVKAAGGANHE